MEQMHKTVFQLRSSSKLISFTTCQTYLKLLKKTLRGRGSNIQKKARPFPIQAHMNVTLLFLSPLCSWLRAVLCNVALFVAVVARLLVFGLGAVISDMSKLAAVKTTTVGSLLSVDLLSGVTFNTVVLAVSGKVASLLID